LTRRTANYQKGAKLCTSWTRRIWRHLCLHTLPGRPARRASRLFEWLREAF